MNFLRYYGPYRTTEADVPVNATTDTPLAAENHRRVYLGISLCGANPGFVTSQGVAQANRGIQMTAGGVAIYELWWELHGPLVGQAWRAFATLATRFSVIEVLAEYDLPTALSGNTEFTDGESQSTVQDDPRGERRGAAPLQWQPKGGDPLAARLRGLRSEPHGERYDWRWNSDPGGESGPYY